MRRLRIALVGAGGAGERHLHALRDIGRTDLVGVTSPGGERAERIAATWGGRAFTDAGRMLDELRPDAVWICVPPDAAPDVCRLAIERRVPFFLEKPLAADAERPPQIHDALRGTGLVVAVGYTWRALDFLPRVRARFADRPPRLVVARWLGDTPRAAWWQRRERSGGQVVEQATHEFDLARALLGEAEVASAVTARHPRAEYPDMDVDDVSAALLRFAGGATGVFVATALAPGTVADMTFVSEGLRVTIVLGGTWPFPEWTLEIDDGREVERATAVRDPFAAEDEAFLVAVEAGDPGAVLVTYEDALGTDRLTRAVVAAAERRGG